MTFELVRGDGIAFMAARQPGSIEAIVTDPPYGLREYEPLEQEKLRRGKRRLTPPGAIWNETSSTARTAP